MSHNLLLCAHNRVPQQMNCDAKLIRKPPNLCWHDSFAFLLPPHSLLTFGRTFFYSLPFLCSLDFKTIRLIKFKSG